MIEIDEIIAKLSLYPFYIRWPNSDRQTEGWQKYKKGWEVRILTDDPDDLESLSNILNELKFKPGRPFLKRNRWIQPLYGQKEVEHFLELVE